MKTSTKSEVLKHILIVLVLLCALLPLYVMVVTAFKTNREFIQSPFSFPSAISVENWILGWYAVKDLLATTMVVTVASVALRLVIAVPAAYFFARIRIPYRTFLWMLFMSLLMMPGIANLLPLYVMLKHFGMLNSIWTISIVLAAGAQVGLVFWLQGFIEEIPKDLFEAAEIDGASHFTQMIHIVVPLCAPIIGTLAVTAFIAAWNEFLLPLILITDPWRQMLSVGLMQMEGQYVKQYGSLMAAYTIASVPLIVLFLFTMKVFVRGLSSGGVKG